jgi:putative flippase GtrA
VTQPAGGVPQRRGATFWQWIRHNLAALVATAVDYTVMITLVEAFRLGPVAATAVGAFAGAATNFTLGRVFTYRATTHGTVAGQSWRYAVVSLASLGWNAGGEFLFTSVFHMQYLAARVVTSAIVSTAWNYPLHRFFVFSRRAHAPTA